MKFIYFTYFLLIFATPYHLNSSELPSISDSERMQLITDDVIRGEVRFFGELIGEGYDALALINADQEKINNLLFEFVDDKISYEDFWLQVDYIKDQAYKESNLYEEKISRLSLSSESNKEFFRPIYDIYFKVTNDVASHLRSMSLITYNQIVSLEEADLDAYDEYSAKSGMLSSDFMLMLATTKELDAALTTNKNSVSSYINSIDVNTIRLNAYLQKINSLYLINQLNRSNLNELVKKAKNINAKIISTKTKKNLEASLNKLKGDLDILELSNNDMQFFYELRDSAMLYHRTAISFADANMMLVELYDESSDLSYTENNLIQDSENFDYANRRITFFQNESVTYANIYEKSLLKLQDILLSYE